MGFYLNGTAAYGLFRRDCASLYYVDKTLILEELTAAVETDYDMSGSTDASIRENPKYISITRPRRFGKTVMANMIASYFGKGIDSRLEFDRLKVSSFSWYQRHLNQHNVIHIVFNELPDGNPTYESYMTRIKNRLRTDLKKAYPAD
ncbi:MAG: AAA family ATPase [Lachnospiraceae bacterium]|nr:AAA family ATPase [Lachnospiraceae bacterium]